MTQDPRHLPIDSPEMDDALDVMRGAFAGMEERINPPSSFCVTQTPRFG